MTNIQDFKIFEDLSEKYSTWIIKYCSSSYENPLFFIWYRDTNDNENILTFENGDFFAVNDLKELKKKLESKENKLTKSENRNLWLKKITEIKMVESCTYDLTSVITKLKKNILDIETIEGFINFINLFDDYINQDKKNSHLQKYIDDELIKKTWDYYYEFIFWPRFNDKEKFESWNLPKLEIDTGKLLLRFQTIILKFENNLKR